MRSYRDPGSTPAAPEPGAPPPRSAGVRIDPQLLYAIPLGIALLVHHFAGPLTGLRGAPAAAVGVGLIALGVGVMWQAVRGFRRARTTLQPWESTTALVTDGIYRYSRNPIYLGYTLVYLGIGLWAGTLWHLVALPVVVLVVTRIVIVKEEAYLTNRFGDAYLRYRDEVRRWI